MPIVLRDQEEHHPQYSGLVAKVYSQKVLADDRVTVEKDVVKEVRYDLLPAEDMLNALGNVQDVTWGSK